MKTNEQLPKMEFIDGKIVQRDRSEDADGNFTEKEPGHVAHKTSIFDKIKEMPGKAAIIGKTIINDVTANITGVNFRNIKNALAKEPEMSPA